MSVHGPDVIGRDESRPYGEHMIHDGPPVHRRRSIRLKHHDYSQPGGYFLTICTRNQECVFGEIVDGEMGLNGWGRMAERAWDELPSRFPLMECDASVVMPNHMHGIIIIHGDGTDRVGAQFIAPAEPIGPLPQDLHEPTGRTIRTRKDAMNRAPTLGEIVRSFKAVVARRIRAVGFVEFRWQRNYYEHVIRGEKDLEKIREYIATNPARWTEDEYFPG